LSQICSALGGKRRETVENSAHPFGLIGLFREGRERSDRGLRLERGQRIGREGKGLVRGAMRDGAAIRRGKTSNVYDHPLIGDGHEC